MRNSTALPLLLLFLSFIHLVTGTFNWDNYPLCARPILQNLAPASCNYGSSNSYDTQLTNNCLCPNRGFFTDVATAIFANCGCTDLTQSAQVASDNCEKFSNYPPALSVTDFISTGDGGQQTCGVDNSSNNATATTGSGWNAANIAAVAVAVIFGSITLAFTVLQLLVAIELVTNPTARRLAPWPYLKKFFGWLCC